MKQLCKRIKKIDTVKGLKKYISDVVEPNHICLKCGRVSNQKKALCEPQKIKKIEQLSI